MINLRAAWLRPDIITEPLVNQWYAWSYLISPATFCRFMTRSHLRVLRSFVESPEVHIEALKNPELAGGPFIQQALEQVAEVGELLERTEAISELVNLSQAIEALDKLLAEHPPGTPLGDLYQQIPAPLQGYVELVYDANNAANVRYLEPFFYRSEYYRPELQAIALRELENCDERAFVLSTPRLSVDIKLQLQVPFADPLLDQLFKARWQPVDAESLAEQLALSDPDKDHFFALFTDQQPRPPVSYTGEGLRVRYMGHACVLLETATTSILVDPLLAYDNPQAMERFSYQDLPEKIDFVVITHNHQDHVMLETLLQLRHKIGQIIIPAGNQGSLIDPSLRLCLQQLGFSHIRELTYLESVSFPEGKITGLPFLGEHGDLDIATKAAWHIEAHGRSVLCVADSDNLDNGLYQHLAQLIGPLDMLFIGMESEGAPYTWAYGPVLSKPVPRAQSRARRLNGSDAKRGLTLVDSLQPQQVFVYAMGMEPWLNYITSIHYTDESPAIVESNELIRVCRAQGRQAERLLGRHEVELLPSQSQPWQAHRLPAQIMPPADVEKSSASQQQGDAQVTPSGANSTTTSTASMKTSDGLSELLDQLHQLGIQLSVNQDKLKVNAPKGALTPELTATIKQHKPELLKLLQSGKAQTNTAPLDNAPQTVDLPSDAQLAQDIQPLTRPVGLPAHQILLTGCTGFVGAFLLSELLQQTHARIHCLVRVAEGSPTAGLARIRTALSDYGLWRESYTDRIQVLPGDLSQPQLGLETEQWQQLALTIDSIYHNGATVHHLLPYEQLKAANVVGTSWLLRLTTMGQAKSFHFLSSLSVLPPPEQAGNKEFPEQAPLAASPIPQGGYNRSKWMAEHLVRQAMARGLAGTIYRPGPTSGASDSGAYNSNDFLYRLLQGYVYSGSAPEGELLLDLLPVDYLARAIVFLSLNAEAEGQCFNLLHPHPVSSNLLFDSCQQAGLGLTRLPYQQWFAGLQQIAQSQPDHPLYPLVALFSSRSNQQSNPASSPTELPYGTKQSRALLDQAPFELPALDNQLFATYLKAMDFSQTKTKEGDA